MVKNIPDDYKETMKSINKISGTTCSLDEISSLYGYESL